jgi:phosphoglucomutase
VTQGGLEPNFVIKEEIFSSINNNYDFETPIYRLALSQKYQKLIKRISAVIDYVETVKDIIDIDITSFSKLPAVGKLYVDSLMNLQNALLPAKTNQFDSEEITVKVELPNQNILSKLYVNYGYA